MEQKAGVTLPEQYNSFQAEQQSSFHGAVKETKTLALLKQSEFRGQLNSVQGAVPSLTGVSGVNR